MSISDDAQRLVDYSGAFVENSINASMGAGEGVIEAIQKLQIAEQAVEHSARTAYELLGGDHSGLGSIQNSANFLLSNINEVEALLEHVLTKLVEVDQNINKHGDTMRDVGNRVIQSGQ